MPSLASFSRQLARVVEGDVRFDAGTIAVYSTDASNYRQLPIGVVCPRHEGDVINAVALARENQVPIVARGGGTSLAGQTCNTALVLDFSRYMTGISGIDPERQTAVIQPGVVQSMLNAKAAQHGFFFPPDPTTKDRCTLGGMIGNNSCGSHSALYGKTVDNLFGLDVLLYDGTRMQVGCTSEASLQAAIASGARVGEIYSQANNLVRKNADLIRAHFPNIPRRVSGYNLDELLPERGFNLARALVGSEGTLALVLGATVKIVPRPKEIVLVVLGFADIFVAADNVPWLLQHRPEALEGFDHNLVDFGEEKGLPGLRLLPNGGAYLIAELGGSTPDEARARGEEMVRQAQNTPGIDTVGEFLHKFQPLFRPCCLKPVFFAAMRRNVVTGDSADSWLDNTAARISIRAGDEANKGGTAYATLTYGVEIKDNEVNQAQPHAPAIVLEGQQVEQGRQIVATLVQDNLIASAETGIVISGPTVCHTTIKGGEYRRVQRRAVDQGGKGTVILE